MSKNPQALFEPAKHEVTAPQAGAELFKSILAPAIEAMGATWDGMKPMFDHGRTELAAALFAGHAHVMYMKGQEAVEYGQDPVTPSVPTQQNEGLGR